MPHNRALIRIFSTALAVLVLSLGSCAGDGSGTPDANETYPAVPEAERPYLLLANKQHPLGSAYAPASLTALSADLTLYGKAIELESATAVAARALLQALHAAGHTDIFITSGYRTYAYQTSLFERYTANEQERHPDWTREQCEAEVLTYSARPGTSEHQTGLCVDLFDEKQMRELENYGHEGSYPDDVGFAETAAFAWLKDNAHLYGFILRYPEDKVSVTGYQYESWHYRYVGPTAAAAIHAAGITLEEYLD